MSTFSMYVARESGLHSLHSLTKVLITLLFVAAGLALPGNWTGYLIVIFIIFPIACWGRVFKNLLSMTWKVSLPFAISVILIQSLFWGEGTPIFEIGVLSPKWEGVMFAAVSMGKIIMVMSGFLLFSMTTRPDTLMISLKQAGVPSSIAYIIITTLQIVPSFQRKALTILDAQRSRGLETEGNLYVRAKAFVPIILPLVLGSLMEVEERAIAIESRGFNSSKKETSLIEIPDTPLQKVIRRVIIFGIFAFVVVGVLWRL